MRIVLVISSLAAGGSERVLSTLANKWAQDGHDVTILTDASPSLDHFRLAPGVKRLALHLQSESKLFSEKVFRNLFRVRSLRAEITRIGPDVVVAFGDTTNTRTLISTLGTSVPVIVSERTDPRQHVLPWPWRALRRLLYPFATAIVVQTESVAQWARGVVRARRVHIIPNPVRPPLPPVPRADVLGTRRTVMGVGRLGSEKGFDLLLHAFARAALPPSAWQLVILGDGPDRAVLEAQVRTLRLQEQVLMPGVVAAPEQWLRHAEMFVLPSRFEGFPNALLEAMQCGLSVAAFDCRSGPAEIVRTEHTGLLVPPGDIDALAAAISRLAFDPDLRHRLGAAAAQDVAKRFNVDRVSAVWEATIASVISRKAQNDFI